MLFRGTDPQLQWMKGVVENVPSGAREAPLEWVCTVRVERRGHFDKDEQGEVFSDHTTVTGWRDEPDPRVHQAGALSFSGAELVEPEVLLKFPGLDRLGTSLSVLRLDGRQVSPAALARINEARPWADLSIADSSTWSPAARAECVRVLATFPALRGLELQRVSLTAEDLVTLSGAVERLEDLTLANCSLDPKGLRAIVERLGSPVHLDLSGAAQGPAVMNALASRLGRARSLWLYHNPIGDEGLRWLLDAGALERVEDLGLGDCELSDTSLRALAEAKLPHLRGLWLGGNPFTDEGVEALAKSPLLAQLEGLSLYTYGRLTERSRAALEGHPLAAALSGTCHLPGTMPLRFLGR